MLSLDVYGLGAGWGPLRVSGEVGTVSARHVNHKGEPLHGCRFSDDCLFNFRVQGLGRV